MSTVAKQPMYRWNAVPWKKVERNVFKLQKRIYRASDRGEAGRVHRLQRMMVNSRSAKFLAVRRVTQDNRGKKTAGVDGVKSLKPHERLALAESLTLDDQAQPVRRIWIPKNGSTEMRPLGIPVMTDRAQQALVKAVLEPEWEARFEPNSYGFRPGRSAHDAIKAIYGAISQKPKYVLDADIAKCFDRINHTALLAKLQTSPTLRRPIKAWLEAGVMDGEELFPTTAGTPQGGIVSPILANVALHGLETIINERFPRRRDFATPRVVRYADDFAVLHEDRTAIEQCQEVITEWLSGMGLELKASKTRITHTLETVEGEAGFEFLGFKIRQYPAGKYNSDRNGHRQALGMTTRIEPSQRAIKRHVEKLRVTIKRKQTAEQAEIIKALNPQINGWSNYYKHVASRNAFHKLGTVVFAMLYAWAKRRHPKKGKGWIVRKYWGVKGGWHFQLPNNEAQLRQHDQTHYQRYVKVAGARSPFDGDWIYWSMRLGYHPKVPPRVASLLKRQKGRCRECGLWFRHGDLMEVDHLIPIRRGGTTASHNQQLLHRHCHDLKTARDVDRNRYV
jgi:RNA-directed DNA polymerase